MINRIKLLVERQKSFLSYFSFSVATSALGFIASLLLMRLITPEEFGRIALFLSIHFFVAPVISFAAESLIAVKKSKLPQSEYESFRCCYVTFSYMAFSAIQLVFITIFFSGLIQESLFLLIPITALAKFLIGLASIEYVMEEKSVQFGMVAFFTTLMSLALTVIFVFTFSAVAEWRIAALLLADIAFLFVRYRGRIKLLIALAFEEKEFKEIVIFGFPLLLSVAPAWALNESDKFIVANYVDLTSVGLYAAAGAIGGFMVTFNTSLLNAMIPKIYQELGVQCAPIMQIVKRYLIRFLLASFVFSVVFSLVYRLTAEIILPEKYLAAREIVYFVILFSLARSLYAVLGLVIDYFGMTRQKLKATTYAGVTAVVSVVFGVTKFGVAGAAIGVGLGYTVLSIILWFELKGKARNLAEITGDVIK